ncbi:K02A2.6-like [Cordylochernes scorpioides]|uniref:RNA-directed DNA polymerase n=1 Tax=Cordylochernes scorpioides TaxID=51811 RepID=A0ABY6L3K2_9ARAC|nr:K02A2.6-like [Cordylochernes scorpioides]
MDQKSGETISKYIIRLKEQAQRCNFGDFLQESLRDRFVAGIIDTSTQKKLLQEEGLTFEGALDIALSAESADNDLHNIKRSENAHQSPQHLHAINNACKHCGRDFLNLFNISFNYLHKLDSFNIDSLLNDYESIFEYKSGPIKGIKCHLDVKADFIPKFYKFRQVPFALKQLVENEIDKLVDLNILSPIDKSDCASPLVCVAKPNGQIRLCADFKKSLNPYLEDVKYPIANIDSVLSNFQANKLFTKLDLSKAYHQIEMDDISKKYLVVSTHKGLYKYNRLAFGIKTASEIFQKTMESFFSGIRDVYIYFDDILIASEDLESHLDILKRTLNILKENNFTINKNKCLFVKNEIEYLGHKINEFGIYPLKDKLACIKNCPVPNNITELKSFLGFLSFYSKFLPNLSDLAHPLYNLLKKNVKWSWNAGTDRSFNSCKNALDETTCLSHYSLNLPLILSCDLSQVGIGATLSHLKDGEERPVCFIYRTLNVHERKYSQVEREGLAIVFAVNKLKNYLFGRKFTIYTDHKPLITIFGDKTNLPPLIANRLHRWALTLSNYSFEIKYKKGKDNIIPDFLSRFPEFQENNLEYNDGSGEILLLNTSIIDHVLVAHETQLDRTLFKLYKIIETGELPSSPNDDLIPYLKRIDDFTILQKCIFLENRMVIPKSLHERVLQLLHESHAGTNKMKMMARSSIWWPGMDSSIEIVTKNCRTCLSNESLPPQRTESWPKYAGPWRRVHMDYFNFKNKLFLLAVDSFSSWVEVSEVPSTSAYFCINFMRNCIARYGFPQVVVSDNGPPFFSSDFGDFLSKNGISHVTSPPYHPKSNGQAEVSVREVKKLLKKQLYENEQVELDLALSRALFFIRTDVNIRKGTSPAELFLGRKIRSRLSVLSKEEVKVSKVNESMPISHETHLFLCELRHSTNFNPEAFRHLVLLGRKSLQLARWRSHLWFNKLCERAQFIPPSLRLSDPVCNIHSNKIILRTQIQLLQARTQGCYSRIRCLSKTIKGIIAQVSNLLPHTTLAEFLVLLTVDIKRQDNLIRACQHGKLSHWIYRYGFLEEFHPDRHPAPTLLNLSSTALSPLKSDVLSLGLKYRPPARADIPRIISVVEPAISSLSHTSQFAIHRSISQILRKPAPPPCQSLGKYRSLRSIQHNSNIVVTRSDKGSQTVILDTVDYTSKMMEILSDHTTFIPVTQSDVSTSVKTFSATETYELIKEAFGDAALSRSRTFEWFSRFQKGREKVNDDQHTGRLRSLRCKENKLKIKELIKSNRIISIKDLSSETGLSVGLCHQIVTKDLDMIWTSSKFVPGEQKKVRMDVCKNMVEMTRTDPEWMQKIITGDETWVYQYDPKPSVNPANGLKEGNRNPQRQDLQNPKKYSLSYQNNIRFANNGLEEVPMGTPSD